VTHGIKRRDRAVITYRQDMKEKRDKRESKLRDRGYRGERESALDKKLCFCHR
jgi:hypothetical protein